MHFSRKLLILCLLTALSGFSIVNAQNDTIAAPQGTEYDMGFNCPVSSTLDSTAAVLWVLMDNCGNGRYYLQGFDVATGAPINSKISDFKEQLTILTYDDYVALNTTPFAFTPDGPLEILYYDDNYDPHTIRLALDPLNNEIETPSADSLSTLLRGLSEYPETTVYNADHTRAVAFGAASLHILDLTTQTELLEIPTEGESYGSFPTFSADGNHLYVAVLNNPDDMTDYNSVLSVYSLPDGEVLNTYDVPSPFLFVSPDEKYAVATINDDAAFVLIELASGSVSEPVQVAEGESRVTKCVNDGRDMSDVDFTTSGRLPIRDLEWLPDSSGFLSVHSYGGEAAGGGAVCYFNHSRLRSYTLVTQS